MCHVEGCLNKNYFTTGLCRKHYKINKNIKKDIRCFACGSFETYGKIDGEYYCSKHAYHIKNKGVIPDRVPIDKNLYVISDNKIIVEIYNKNMDVAGSFITDLENLEIVEKYKWSSLPNGYIVTKLQSGELIYFHKEILKTENIVDHIDRDNRNNCFNNLRLANEQLNALNRKIKSTNTSGVTGVSFRLGSWKARIMIDKKEKFVYCGDSFDMAVKSRIENESIYYKNFSPLFNHETQTIQLTYHSHDDNKQTFIECNLQGEIIKFEKLS